MPDTFTTPSRRTKIPLTQWKVTVPSHLAIEVEARLFDHARGKPAYGRRSQLISELLEICRSTQQDFLHVDEDLPASAR